MKKYQEQLYQKYLKKIQSLEETKSSLEQLVRTTGYVSKVDFKNQKVRTAVLLDDMPESKTSTSNSSSSLNTDHIDSQQVRSRSGAATPTSNRSTSSLLEEAESSHSSTNQLTRQYSLRNSREGEGKPMVTCRAPSPFEDTDMKPPPPPVNERTTSLTPNTTRRVSQPLVDISTDNISIRSNKSRDSNSSNGLHPVGHSGPPRPIKPDHQNHKIQITSKKEIESRYCKKHETLRKQNQNSNSN